MRKRPALPGRYCTICFGPVQLIERKGRRTFRCRDCGGERWQAIINDPRLISRVTKRGIKHFNVGALIEKKGRYLLQLRAMPPHRWNLIAGHLCKDEPLTRALRREVKEETGLTVLRAQHILSHANLPDRCYRGADIHAWELYHCTAQGRLKKNEESRALRWFTPREIITIPLVPATKKILTLIGILKK